MQYYRIQGFLQKKILTYFILPVLALLLTQSCTDTSPIFLSVNGVPRSGLEAAVEDVDLAGSDMVVLLESGKSIRITSSKKHLDEFWLHHQTEFNTVSWIKISSFFSPAGPSYRLELYDSQSLMAVFGIGSPGNTQIIGDHRLLPGTETLGETGDGRRMLTNCIIRNTTIPNSDMQAAILSPVRLEHNGQEWQFILLNASTSAEHAPASVQVQESSSGAAVSSEETILPITKEQLPFQSDWIIFPVPQS